MNNDYLSDKIISEILTVYHDLNSPDFGWVKLRYDARPYAGIIEKIRRVGFSIIEETDLNEDVSQNLHLQNDSECFILKLSLVAKYALIFRADSAGTYHVLSPDNVASCPSLKSVTDILSNDAILILDRPTLEYLLPLHLFNSEIDETNLYNALFTDEPIPSWADDDDE
jgi:hypothetical protein